MLKELLIHKKLIYEECTFPEPVWDGGRTKGSIFSFHDKSEKYGFYSPLHRLMGSGGRNLNTTEPGKGLQGLTMFPPVGCLLSR